MSGRNLRTLAAALLLSILIAGPAAAAQAVAPVTGTGEEGGSLDPNGARGGDEGGSLDPNG